MSAATTAIVAIVLFTTALVVADKLVPVRWRALVHDLLLAAGVAYWCAAGLRRTGRSTSETAVAAVALWAVVFLARVLVRHLKFAWILSLARRSAHSQQSDRVEMRKTESNIQGAAACSIGIPTDRAVESNVSVAAAVTAHQPIRTATPTARASDAGRRPSGRRRSPR